MADIAATDVTYTILSQGRDARGKRQNIVKLVFGDAALTYPAGGVPLTKGKMGVPNTIEAMIPMGGGTTGYGFQYNKATDKLVLFQNAAHTHNLLLKNAAVADGATTRVNAGANLLGANTGGDLTVTGGGANGGVVLSAALVSSEPSAVAIAAQTVHAMVIGW